LPPDLPPPLASEARALEEQIAAHPQAKGLYVKLADLYQQAGKKDAAISALDRLLVIDPKNVLAKHRLDVLRGTVQHHHPPPAAPAHPRPTHAGAHAVARRRSSRRGLWIGLGVAAVVVVAGAVWMLSGPTRLVAGRTPVWSPQGDRVAFLTEQGGSATLSVWDLKTGRARAIGAASAYTSDGSGVAWSPDGRRIAFVAPAPGEWGEEAVFVAEVESGEKRMLAAGSSPTWAPDGQSVGMFCNERPRVTASMETDEGEIPTEVGGGWHGVCLVGIADRSVRRLQAVTGSRLAFSPQARTLVLERFPENMPEEAAGTGPTSGQDEIQSLADEAVAGRATNFYEGRRDLGRAIEARGLDKRGVEGVGSVFGDLFALDADSGAMTQLTRDGRSTSPRWTADGRLAYVHQPEGASRAELWLMGGDGSGQQRAVETAIELFDPDQVAVGPDRRVVFSSPVKNVNAGLAKVMTGDEAADLYVVRPGDTAPRRLENRHTFKQRFALSPDGRRLVYEARDGKTGQTELWLMKP
jgi:Tol biopolymer transport system component